MATLTVKLFGPQAQLAQLREVTVDVESDRVTAELLLSAVASACPALADSIGHSKLAVNHAYVGPADTVAPGDEVALIGMLGGG